MLAGLVRSALNVRWIPAIPGAPELKMLYKNLRTLLANELVNDESEETLTLMSELLACSEARLSNKIRVSRNLQVEESESNSFVRTELQVPDSAIVYARIHEQKRESKT